MGRSTREQGRDEAEGSFGSVALPFFEKYLKRAR